jgi:hypothetical protein
MTTAEIRHKLEAAVHGLPLDDPDARLLHAAAYLDYVEAVARLVANDPGYVLSQRGREWLRNNRHPDAVPPTQKGLPL